MEKYWTALFDLATWIEKNADKDDRISVTKLLTYIKSDEFTGKFSE